MDIDTIANLLVAIGTGGLAIVTYTLVRVTKGVNEGTLKLAAVAEKELATMNRSVVAQIQPWLTPVSLNAPSIGIMYPVIDVDTSSESTTVELRLQNIGNGLALIQPNSTRLYVAKADDPDQMVLVAYGQVTDAAVGRGSETTVSFTITREAENDPPGDMVQRIVYRSTLEDIDEPGNWLQVLLTYVDSEAGSPTTMRVRAYTPRRNEMHGRVRSAAYFHAPDQEADPFVTVEF